MAMFNGFLYVYQRINRQRQSDQRESPATASGPLPARSFRHGSPGCVAGPIWGQGVHQKNPLESLSKETWWPQCIWNMGYTPKIAGFSWDNHGFRDAMWAWIKSPADVFFQMIVHGCYISHQIRYRQCSLQLVSVDLRLLRLQDFAQQKCCGSGCFLKNQVDLENTTNWLLKY